MKDENLLRMERCPKFISCNIPRCPLDEFMWQRTELPEDEICPLRRLTERHKKTKRMPKMVLSATLRSLVALVPIKNRKTR